MDSTPRNPTNEGEEEVNLFLEVQGIFDKFFKLLFVIMAFKSTDTGEEFYRTHPSIMMAVVLAIVVYFSAWLLVTILQLHLRTFLPIIICIILAIGGIASALALSL